MAVLECLAAAGGEVVGRDEVFEKVWPGVIVTDDALAQCIVELRKAFGDSARDARVIRTIPKVGFCLIPPVTPQAEAPPDSKIPPDDRLKPVLLGILVLALVGIALYPFVPAGKKPDVLLADVGERSSIAVLPFVNRSAQIGDEYFSDGMHDELLSRLSHIPGLRVISRTSVNQYRETTKSLPEIARELSVGTILEGSVQRSGNRVRINVQLIEARSDDHLWSHTYDSDFVDIFEVQDEISSAIALALKERLGIDVEVARLMPPTESTEAHDAYLRGRYLVSGRTAEGVDGAVREFERAIALDPGYAVAHAELAIALVLAGISYFQLLPWDEAIARAETHANRALALDPDLAEAHAALGRLAWMNGSFEFALEYFNRSLEINPNYSDVHSWAALISARVGRYEEILPHQLRALRLDPVSVVAMNNYVHSLIEMGRLDDAERELEKIRTISPRIYADYNGRLNSASGKWSYLVQGGLDELRIVPGDLRARGLLSWRFLMLGLDQEALAFMDKPNPEMLHRLDRPLEATAAAKAALASAKPNITFARRKLGMIYAATGEYAKARPLLEDSWHQNGSRVTVGVFGSSAAVALHVIRRDAGEDVLAAELLAAIRDDVQRLRNAGFATTDYMSTDFEEGLAAYLAGEREKGLSLMARASADGYFIWPDKAYLKELYEDPGFTPILTEQAARQSLERERFLKIVCTENPYEDFWQPAEGTCMRAAMG